MRDRRDALIAVAQQDSDKQWAAAVCVAFRPGAFSRIQRLIGGAQQIARRGHRA